MSEKKLTPEQIRAFAERTCGELAAAFEALDVEFKWRIPEANHLRPGQYVFIVDGHETKVEFKERVKQKGWSNVFFGVVDLKMPDLYIDWKRVARRTTFKSAASRKGSVSIDVLASELLRRSQLIDQHNRQTVAKEAGEAKWRPIFHALEKEFQPCAKTQLGFDAHGLYIRARLTEEEARAVLQIRANNTKEENQA